MKALHGIGICGFCLLACSADVGQVGDTLLSGEATTGDTYLVWSRGETGVETVWLSSAGVELERRPGILFGAAGRLMRWNWQSAKIDGVDCVCVGRTDPTFATTPPECVTREDTDVIELVDVKSGVAKPILTLPPVGKADGEGGSMPGRDGRLVGQVGPYLFIEVSGYMMGCGAAHGTGWVTFEVRDAITGEVVEVLTDAERRALLATDNSVALQRQMAAEDVFDPGSYEISPRPRCQDSRIDDFSEGKTDV